MHRASLDRRSLDCESQITSNQFTKIKPCELSEFLASVEINPRVNRCFQVCYKLYFKVHEDENW